MAKRKLNIMVFVENFSNATETFVYNQVVGLAPHHNLWVVCLNRVNEKSFPYPKVKLLDFKEHRIKRKVRNVLQKFNLYLNFHRAATQKRLNEFIAAFKPDIIHCHFGIQALILLDNLQSQSIPVFITFHGYDASKIIFESPIYRRRLRQVLAKPFVHSLFVSQFLLDNLTSHKIYPKNAKVLFLGVDPIFFQRSNPRAPGSITYLQISSFTEKKGHEFTLKAFQIFLQKHPDFSGKLVLAGEGPLLAPMKQLAKDLNIQDFVQFPGLVGRTEVKALMENATVFLHHSITAKDGNTEGLPTVIMEAMSMELPIISTYHSGIPELVVDGVHGYLVKEKDIADYAHKLDEIRTWRYQPENRKTILDGFTQAIHLSKLEKYYLEALSHDD